LGGVIFFFFKPKTGGGGGGGRRRGVVLRLAVCANRHAILFPPLMKPGNAVGVGSARGFSSLCSSGDGSDDLAAFGFELPLLDGPGGQRRG